MMTKLTVAFAFGASMLAASVAWTQPALSPSLADIGFLVGHWTNGAGAVADTGGTSTGMSDITIDANGGALLRRDHTNLFDAKGKATGGFDQVMLIYPEGGMLHADYTDGQHLIHYTQATVVPGKSVTFMSASVPTAPAFRLSYVLSAPDTLSIDFGMTPPGQTTPHPIASGTLKKSAP